MNKNLFEYVIGIVIIVAAVYFLHDAYYKAEIQKNNDEYYPLVAKFNNIDGINIGSEVRISGIKVGRVIDKYVDHETYRAVIKLNIQNKLRIPADSSAKISSDGLMGNKFVSITPGADGEMMENGEEIQYTQSSVNLETLIGKMIFSKEQ